MAKYNYFNFVTVILNDSSQIRSNYYTFIITQILIVRLSVCNAKGKLEL